MTGDTLDGLDFDGVVALQREVADLRERAEKAEADCAALLDERDRLRTDDFPKTITFKAYFIVDEDGNVRMIDTDPADMLLDGDNSFGPYRIEIPIPEDIALAVRMRAITIQGEVGDG